MNYYLIHCTLTQEPNPQTKTAELVVDFDSFPSRQELYDSVQSRLTEHTEGNKLEQIWSICEIPEEKAPEWDDTYKQ